MLGKGVKRILKWLWQSAVFAFYTTSLAIHAVDNRHGDTLRKKLARVWYSNLKIGLLQLVSAFLCYAHWRVLRHDRGTIVLQITGCISYAKQGLLILFLGLWATLVIMALHRQKE